MRVPSRSLSDRPRKVVHMAGVNRGTFAGMGYAFSYDSVTCSRLTQTSRNRDAMPRFPLRRVSRATEGKRSVTGSFHQFGPRRAPMIPRVRFTTRHLCAALQIGAAAVLTLLAPVLLP